MMEKCPECKGIYKRLSSHRRWCKGEPEKAPLPEPEADFDDRTFDGRLRLGFAMMSDDYTD
jgi:hypothetical protein